MSKSSIMVPSESNKLTMGYRLDACFMVTTVDEYIRISISDFEEGAGDQSVIHCANLKVQNMIFFGM